MFGNRKGGPLRESKVLTKVLQPAAVEAGLGRVTWHQFRHIHSSLLNDLNVPSKIAQGAIHVSLSAEHFGPTVCRGAMSAGSWVWEWPPRGRPFLTVRKTHPNRRL